MNKLVSIFLIACFSQTSFAKECSLKELYGGCEKLMDGGPILRENKDGTLTPNFFKGLAGHDEFQSEEEKKAFQKLISAPDDPVAVQTKLEERMDFIRNAYIEEALQGRKENDPNLDPATVSIITRLRTLKIARASEKETECAGMGTNAFYNPHEHKIKVCNALAKAPDLMLMFIAAHEVGHSIDSCRLSTALLKVEPDVAKRTCPKKDLALADTPSFLASHAGEYLSADEFMVHSKDIEACGFAKVVIAPQYSLGNNAVAKTVDCVMKAEGGDYANSIKSFDEYVKEPKAQLRAMNPTASEEALDKVIQQNMPIFKESYEKYKAMMNEFTRKAMGCSGPAIAANLKANPAPERSADSLATRVVLKYVRSKKLSSSEKTNLIEFQSQAACGYKLSNGKRFNNPNYPVGEERLNILLQEPEIQNALGCKYSGSKKCASTDLNSTEHATDSGKKPAESNGGTP